MNVNKLTDGTGTGTIVTGCFFFFASLSIAIRCTANNYNDFLLKHYYAFCTLSRAYFRFVAAAAARQLKLIGMSISNQLNCSIPAAKYQCSAVKYNVIFFLKTKLRREEIRIFSVTNLKVIHFHIDIGDVLSTNVE